jgi:hypothetical protein
MLDLHNAAQRISAQAAVLTDQGDKLSASRLYGEAAALERKALDRISPEKLRTRGIVAVSFVSQLYKGRLYQEARVATHQLLTLPETLPEFAVEQLYAILESIADELELARNGLQYADRSLDIKLSGGEVYTGSAPADVAIAMMSGWDLLVLRVAEYVGEFKYRMRGLPEAELFKWLSPRLVAPQRGSFRFTVKLTEPLDQPLPGLGPIPRVTARRVITETMEIINILSRGALSEIQARVPDTSYRRAITNLVRNVTPSGKKVGYVEVAALLRGESVSKLELSKESRQNIGRVVQEDNPGMPGERIERLSGNLRLGDVDRAIVTLRLPEGEKKTISIPDDFAEIGRASCRERVCAYV